MLRQSRQDYISVGGFVASYQINPGNNPEKEPRLRQFFDMYFKNFKKLLLVNLLFFIPTLAAVLILYAIYLLSGSINVFIISAAIIVLEPFYAGVALVCRYVYTGTEFSVARAFFKGVRGNLKQSIFHGIVTYIIFVVSYFSLSLYYGGISASKAFLIPFVITLLIVLYVLFALYYVNVMTVTVELSIKNIYRNCLLFAFGELKNNLFATGALFILSAVVFGLVMVFFNPTALILLSVLLISLFLPSAVQYIITFFVYDSMVSVLDVNAKKDADEEEPKQKKPALSDEEAQELSGLVRSTEDEYIYYNGRMIRRTDVEKLLDKED